jgi:hypothetical protein
MKFGPILLTRNLLRLWMQVQMEHLMKEYAAQFKKPSLDGEQLLSRLKSLGDTPDGFLRLDTVLPPSQSSIEELREEAYFEKYGIRFPSRYR